MPTYEHVCDNCEEEFEDIYSMKDDPPTLCPICGVDGWVRRIISIPAVGIVELTGGDLKNKLIEDGRKMKRHAQSNEKALANLVGEDKYQANEVGNDYAKKELKKIPAATKKKSE